MRDYDGIQGHSHFALTNIVYKPLLGYFNKDVRLLSGQIDPFEKRSSYYAIFILAATVLLIIRSLVDEFVSTVSINYRTTLVSMSLKGKGLIITSTLCSKVRENPRQSITCRSRKHGTFCDLNLANCDYIDR